MLITKESEVMLASKSITLFENLGYEIPKYWDKKNGYSVFRINANHRDDMPTREQIDEQVQKLLHGWHYVEIQM